MAKGKKVISARWIDTNKGDLASPDYRSRLVGREIKTDSRLDLFSATPPLEVLKMLMSVCAQGQRGEEPLRAAVVDIKRAYFYTETQKDMYIEILSEDKE